MPGDCYVFGDFTVDRSRACLLRADTQVPLRPKSFDLLCYLVEHAGRLASKEELLSAIWPGLVVTDDSLSRCISDVRAALGDGAQQVVQTVPRRGYLFIPTVRKPGADEPAALAPQASAPPLAAHPFRAWFVASLAAGLLVVATLAYYAIALHRPVAPRLSLVVLPFTSLGADPKQDYLADIITDDLTSALSRLRGATVIATSSASSLKGKQVDLRQLGAELQVRYVLQGSVRRDGDRVNISTRLTDADSAKSLWSDRFELERGDLPRTQDDIVARIANALDAELILADSSRSVRATGAPLDAEDLAMQCEAAAGLQQGESGAPSYDLCQRALQLDPSNVRALVRLAMYYGERVERVQSPDRQADLARARGWVTRALAVDPRYYAAHCANAIVLGGEHRVRDAIAAAERCRDLNPSHAHAYRMLATFHFFLAEPAKVLEFVDRGLRLSPRDLQLASFLLFKGWAYFMMGRDEEALAWMRRAAAASPDSPSILAPLASVLALTGHDDEARATLGRYLALKRTRTRTLAQWDHLPDASDAFIRFDMRFKSGLRKAGMPER